MQSCFCILYVQLLLASQDAPAAALSLPLAPGSCSYGPPSPCRSLQQKRKKNADAVKDGGCGKAEAPGEKGKKR